MTTVEYRHHRNHGRRAAALSLIANFVLLWAGPNSSLPLVGLGLILVGTVAVGYGVLE